MRPLRPDQVYMTGVLQPFAARMPPTASVDYVKRQFTNLPQVAVAGEPSIVATAESAVATVGDRVRSWWQRVTKKDAAQVSGFSGSPSGFSGSPYAQPDNARAWHALRIMRGR